jgi:hypothetical protein
LIFIVLELAFWVLTHRLFVWKSRDKRIRINYWRSSPYKLSSVFKRGLSIVHWMPFGACMLINPHRRVKILGLKPSLNNCLFRLFLLLFIRKLLLQFVALAYFLFVHNSHFLHFVLQFRIFFLYLLSFLYHICLHPILICRPQLSFL